MSDICLQSEGKNMGISVGSYVDTEPDFGLKKSRNHVRSVRRCTKKEIHRSGAARMMKTVLTGTAAFSTPSDGGNMGILDTYQGFQTVLSPRTPSDMQLPATMPAGQNGVSHHPSSEIDIGAVVDGRYEILSEISRGGYGIVYRARQLGVDRVVALKRLRSQNDFSIVQRFLLETSIIKNLIHPNTIQLFDAGMDHNHLYLVMEFIDGPSLYSILRGGRVLEPLRALNITRQILKSVNEAHQRGIVHRDLKPSNVLVRRVIGERDFIKVLDFGIAKVHAGSGMRLTRDGSILGTPQYLSPEAIRGMEITAQSDLFSIGLMLHEMLTGQHLLPYQFRDVFTVLSDRAPLSIHPSLRGTILEPFLKRALDKDCECRYRSAEAMLRDLEKIEMVLKMPEKTPPLPQKDRIFAYRLLVVLMLNVALLICVGILFGKISVSLSF